MCNEFEENSFIYPYDFEEEFKKCSPFHLPIEFCRDTIDFLSKNNDKSRKLKEHIIEMAKEFENSDFNEYFLWRSLNKDLENQKLSKVFDDFVEEKNRNPKRIDETVQGKLRKIRTLTINTNKEIEQQKTQ